MKLTVCCKVQWHTASWCVVGVSDGTRPGPGAGHPQQITVQQGSSLLWCLLAGSGAQPLGLLPGAGCCPLCGVMVSWTHGMCVHIRSPIATVLLLVLCGCTAPQGDVCQGWAPLLRRQQWNLLCHRVLVLLGGLGAAAWLCQEDASPTRSTSAPQQHRC